MKKFFLIASLLTSTTVFAGTENSQTPATNPSTTQEPSMVQKGAGMVRGKIKKVEEKAQNVDAKVEKKHNDVRKHAHNKSKKINDKIDSVEQGMATTPSTK